MAGKKNAVAKTAAPAVPVTRDDLIAACAAARVGKDVAEDTASARRLRVQAIARSDTAPRADRPVAMLANMTLADEDHAAAFLGRFSRRGRDPNLNELRLARSLLDRVDRALLDGTDPIWQSLRRAHAALPVDPRFEAVGILAHLVSAKLRLSSGLKQDLTPAAGGIQHPRSPALLPRRREGYGLEIERCIGRLARLDPRLAGLTREQVHTAIDRIQSPTPTRGRGKRSVYLALAELAVDTGAFGGCVTGRDRLGSIDRFARDLSSFIGKPKRGPKKTAKKRRR